VRTFGEHRCDRSTTLELGTSVPATSSSSSARGDHSESLTGLMLKTAGLPPHEAIKDLDRKMRCRECNARGHVSISIRWADGRALFEES
jgi:hypothetical protein